MPTKPRASAGHHFSGYALLTLLMVGAMLAYQAWESNTVFRDYHQQLAITSVNGATEELELLLTELQRSMRLFSDEHQQMFEIISRDPDDPANWLLLETGVTRHFPEHFSMTLTDASGGIFRPDFDNRVDDICHQDILTFIENGYQLQGYIHPNPLGYHFDIMVTWGSGDKPNGVFFLSFPPDKLAHTLQRIQPPGHRLLLLRTDKTGLIDVASVGSRVQLQREFFLSVDEQAHILARRNIHNSRWVLVDLPDPGLFRDEDLRNIGFAIALFLAFLAVGLTMVLQLRKNEQRRQQAEELARQHQSNLAHVDRLNTMGEMASNLAHELNQPLAAISTYCQAGLRLAEKNGIQSAKLEHALEQASIQSQRAGKIIHRMRRFADKGIAQRELIELNPVINNAIEFVATDLARRDITLTRQLADKLPAVMADMIQIEQVIINLLNNAIEAMSTISGRQRLLTISSKQLDSMTVRVTVTDTGIGMDDTTLGRIFDTFYTTRDEGMGLGLSISHSIIEAHGGKLMAQSEPDAGATFFFTLSTKAKSL